MAQRSDRTLFPKSLSLKIPSRATIPLALAAVQAVTAPSAQARPFWTSGTFVYADLCTLSETGERTGQRIVLRRSPNGDALFYETAADAAPIPAGTVTLDDETRTLAFAVGTGGGTVSFHGTLDRDALSGTLEDGSGAHAVRLRRVLRSHAHERCPGETTGSLGAPH